MELLVKAQEGSGVFAWVERNPLSAPGLRLCPAETFSAAPAAEPFGLDGTEGDTLFMERKLEPCFYRVAARAEQLATF
jgi:hypothetical protein